MNTYVDKRIHLCYNFSVGINSMNKYNKYIIIISSVSALTIGFISYILFRTDTYIHNIFSKIIILPQIVIEEPFLSFIKYYLADFAWAFSLTLNDTTTDIQVEVEEFISFNDKVITKTFKIAE